MQSTVRIDTPPVACTPAMFTDDERKSHERALVATILGLAIAKHERHDGVELVYQLDDEITPALMAWIMDERRCCPFLTFELRIDAGGDRIRLTLRGPEGTLEVLRAAFAIADVSP